VIYKSVSDELEISIIESNENRYFFSSQMFTKELFKGLGLIGTSFPFVTVGVDPTERTDNTT